MSEETPRRRDPDALQRRLLAAARELALGEGLAAVTIQSVATRAGATKGGLFHHFASKERLLEGLFQEELDSLDQAIDGYIAEDPEPYGCFTRAYIANVLADDAPASLYAVLMLSKDLTPIWDAWLAKRAAQHQDSDQDPQLVLARYAADGIWINRLWGSHHRPEPADSPASEALRETLMRMTYPTDCAESLS